jgi:hypothetical protein
MKFIEYSLSIVMIIICLGVAGYLSVSLDKKETSTILYKGVASFAYEGNYFKLCGSGVIMTPVGPESKDSLRWIYARAFNQSYNMDYEQGPWVYVEVYATIQNTEGLMPDKIIIDRVVTLNAKEGSC